MRLTVYPYTADDRKWDKYVKMSFPQEHTFVNPINEEYFDIQGFDLSDDGTLSFVQKYEGTKMVKKAASIKLTPSQSWGLKKVLEGYKFPPIID